MNAGIEAVQRLGEGLIGDSTAFLEDFAAEGRQLGHHVQATSRVITVIQIR